MSDFLSGLLDRAFERAPMLERRRPSRFEPPTDVDGKPFVGARQLPEDQASDDVETFDVADGPARRPTLLPPRQPRRLEAAELPGEIAREPRNPAAEAEPPRAIGTIGEKDVERARPVGAPATSSAREASRSAEAPVVDRDTAASRVALPDARPPVVRPPVANADSAGERRIQQDPSNRGEPAPARPAKSVVASTRESVLRPVSVTTRSPQVPFTRRESAEPTIEVTIGRIEVRAVSAPPTTPGRAGRPASPKLTLEDYLKSRGRGRT